MAASHPDQEFITERALRYEKAYNSANVDEVLAFMSEDIVLSDYGTT
jgi:ketosteroid isomerase-like protein